MATILTDRELSRYLKVGYTTLYRLRRAGMPYIRVGGSIRYDLEAVFNWLEERESA
jgi:excisionase family DNA binding protein